MSFLIRVVFAIAACALMAVAAVLLVYAPYTALREGLGGDTLVHEALLNIVGYLIVAIALFDVAKYFFEEEVPANREKRTAADARRGLTKFLSTIIIALFLEALVLLFETAREEVAEVVYPALLVVIGCVALVSLGLFQRLSASVEREVGPETPPREQAAGDISPNEGPAPLASPGSNR
ncbi:GNAT family acetyltransferase [Ancylobacter oerskovii]|uniref:GNAT family acetyltransferase n=1 Tax=Ancylobacter oerskovii TaxID=459519 RepID=A0ABW4Z336_9HYPH|nr:GNAT family acetyltransferase [Ancylobacter oerskovii]MBS7546128.1 GNAT family acetyltransferase [Ancylobacter oerskovii]